MLAKLMHAANGERNRQRLAAAALLANDAAHGENEKQRKEGDDRQPAQRQ